MAIVYKITNKVNGKCYIGQTVRTLEQRWNSHISAVRQGGNFRFHSAIRKYGFDLWVVEVIFEHEDVNICKNKEEELIKEYKLTDSKFGYNAKPGGCGGWIVHPDNYDSWKANISKAHTGNKNGNCIKTTNEELVNLGIKICKENNLDQMPRQHHMVKLFLEKGLKFPKSFTKYRFDGSYEEYARLIAQELNIEFKPYVKTKEHKIKLADAQRGKKYITTEEGKRIYVKN